MRKHSLATTRSRATWEQPWPATPAGRSAHSVAAPAAAAATCWRCRKRSRRGAARRTDGQFKAPRRSTSCCSALARAPSSVATRRSSCEPIVSFLRWWTTSTGENEPFRETPRETVKRSGRRAAPRAEENHRVELKDYRDIHERLLSRISSVLLGQEEVGLHALAALLPGGHLLIECRS